MLKSLWHYRGSELNAIYDFESWTRSLRACGVATGLRDGRPGIVVWLWQKREINLLSKASKPAMRPSHTLIQGVCGKLFFWGKSGWGVNLATHLHLTPRSRKSETKPSRCHIPLLVALGQLNFNFILKATFLFGTRFHYYTEFLTFHWHLRHQSR
jgi:hypothetical protein